MNNSNQNCNLEENNMNPFIQHSDNLQINEQIFNTQINSNPFINTTQILPNNPLGHVTIPPNNIQPNKFNNNYIPKQIINNDKLNKFHYIQYIQQIKLNQIMQNMIDQQNIINSHIHKNNLNQNITPRMQWNMNKMELFNITEKHTHFDCIQNAIKHKNLCPLCHKSSSKL